MKNRRSVRMCLLQGVIAFALVLSWTVWGAAEVRDPQEMFTQHCGVCHGGDRGGYIGPGLTKERHTTLSEAAIRTMITTGVFETLMPPWGGKLTSEEIHALAAMIKSRSRANVSWTLADIKRSLRIYVADESTLPDKPTYPIDDMGDLMAVMSRGRYATGNSKVLFFDGRRNVKVGEIPTERAPHIIDFDPSNPRWAYIKSDDGVVYKVDLYSMQATRSVRVGLNGPAIACSYDGRFVLAGSFVPHTAVMLDAKTLEPVKLLELKGVDLDGNMVESDSGINIATPYAGYFAIALENSGQVWIIDYGRPDMPIYKIKNVGRHLHDAFLSPDGRYLMVASYADNFVAAVDLKEKRVVKRLPGGCQPHVGSGAVLQIGGRTLGFVTNIRGCDRNVVSVWDLDTWAVVKQIPVMGPTESPAAHPKAPYVAVDIVGTGPDADKIQFIDKHRLEVVKTIQVGGHAHFPEYTARGDFLYVSAGYHGDELVIYRSDNLEKVKTFDIETPAGIFTHVRPKIITVGLEKSLD